MSRLLIARLLLEREEYKTLLAAQDTSNHTTGVLRKKCRVGVPRIGMYVLLSSSLHPSLFYDLVDSDERCSLRRPPTTFILG